MVVKLSIQDVQELKSKGFTEEEINKAITEIEKEDLQTSTGVKSDPRSMSKTSAFSTRQMDDIARYQLELNDILEQTEHILKGDIVEYKQGVKIWITNPNPKNNPFNDEGVRRIMLQLQTYINRHIILGDYDMKDINKIMKDYGKKLSNLIFMKYEEMGMDTETKRQEYVSIVTDVINLVYASYKRAEGGGERRSLREMVSIQQSHQSGGTGVPINAQSNQKIRGILNPMRYIGGKYA